VPLVLDRVAESDLTGTVSPMLPPPPVDILVSIAAPLPPFCIVPDSVPLPAVPELLLSPRFPLQAVTVAKQSDPTIHGVHFFIRAPSPLAKRRNYFDASVRTCYQEGGDTEVTAITGLQQFPAILTVLESQPSLIVQGSRRESSPEFEVPAVEDASAVVSGR
jgi:hypothetical protein